jgi:hypothetical protein
MHRMAMGRRKRDRQVAMWITTTELPTAAGHPFYRRLNQLLREHGCDNFAEAQCGNFYAATIQRTLPEAAEQLEAAATATDDAVVVIRGCRG